LFARMLANGKWSAALANAGSADGFLCEYAVASLSNAAAVGSVTLTAGGCFPKTCAYSSTQACETDPRCAVASTGKCGVTSCATASDVQSCNGITGCYFDATNNVCTSITSNACASVSMTQCAATSGCAVSASTCVATGCGKYPDTASCDNDAQCAMGSDGVCRAKLCGYSLQSDCLQLGGSNCEWNSTTLSCSTASCVLLSSTTCKTKAGCVWNEDMAPQCSSDSCGGVSQTSCGSVVGCMWTGSTCTKDVCALLNTTICGSTSGCAVSKADSSACVASTCNYATSISCYANGCQWSNVSVPGSNEYLATCKSVSDVTTGGGASADDSTSAAAADCSETTKNMSGIGILLAVFAVLLFAGLGWMVKRQNAFEQASRLDFTKKLIEADELDGLMERPDADHQDI